MSYLLVYNPGDSNAIVGKLETIEAHEVMSVTDNLNDLDKSKKTKKPKENSWDKDIGKSADYEYCKYCKLHDS